MHPSTKYSFVPSLAFVRARPRSDPRRPTPPRLAPKIANIGFLEVDNQTMTRAVASNTLFIHGSLTGGGGSMFLPHAATYTSPAQQLVGRNEPQEKCTAECGSRSPNHHAVPGTSSVCDRSCHAGANGPRFRGYNCGAGDAEVFGAHCRTCFEDVGEAQAAEDRLALRNLLRGSEDKEDHVIMCDTLLPPLVSACNDKCLRKADTVRARASALVRRWVEGGGVLALLLAQKKNVCSLHKALKQSRRRLSGFLWNTRPAVIFAEWFAVPFLETCQLGAVCCLGVQSTRGHHGLALLSCDG